MQFARNYIIFFFILPSDPPTEQVLTLFDLRSSEDSICEIGNKGECPGIGEVCCAKPKIIIVDPKPKCSDHEDFSCVGLQVSYFVFTHDQIAIYTSSGDWSCNSLNFRKMNF